MWQCQAEICCVLGGTESKKTQAATAWKRKAVSGEVDKLKTKRQKLETDRSESLLAAADDHAEKAGCSHKLTLIAKSNAMTEEGS